jgi:hypothetical protein
MKAKKIREMMGDCLSASNTLRDEHYKNGSFSSHSGEKALATFTKLTNDLMKIYDEVIKTEN